MNKHTPVPWACKAKAWQDSKDPLFWNCDVIKGGIRIGKVSGRSKEEAEANARHIVTAVNFYEQKIYITVKGGVAIVTKCPANINVIIKDLD